MNKHLFAVAVYVVWMCMVWVDPAPQITFVCTPNCGYCATQEATLKSMGIKYATRSETQADAKYKGYPVLEMEGRKPLEGLHNRAAVERWIKGK